MKEKYLQVIDYWDDLFDSGLVNLDFIRTGIPIKDIEESLWWMLQKKGHILDFGCGNGTLLLRSVALTGEWGLGIDLSGEAIKRAKEASQKLKISNQVEFVAASVEYLKDINDSFFTSVILSNILDNLLPSDGLLLIETIKKKIKKGGRLFLKLNDYKDKEKMIADGAVEIGENVFKEKDGLYLWNIDNKAVRSIFEGVFEIEAEKKVELMGTINRSFHLIKR